MLIRALVAFLAIPGVVAFVVPLLLVRFGTGPRPFRWIALVPLLTGTALLLDCVREFYVTGKGTLAPWDPPRRLVASGLYRYTRNPMYLAVTVILLGWAVAFSSLRLLAYALVLMSLFHLHVVFVEEPALRRSFRDEWTRYAAAVPRWVFRSRAQVALAWVGAVIVVVIAGLFYEAISDDLGSGAYPPPGQLVDIGGRRLHLLCIGEGEPTVLFEPSGWGTALSAPRVRERVAERTRVCSYDRRGLGWSDPGPSAASAADLARDLAVLQDRAGLHAPFVIVAASIGGLTAELFARQFPERVAGLVFVDAANSGVMPLGQSVSRLITPAACTTGVLAHLGLVRLVDPFSLATDDSEQSRRAAALTYNPRPWTQLCAMARALPETVRAFEEARPLRADLPVTVLTASTPAGLVPDGLSAFVDLEEVSALLRASHQQLAGQSSKGQWHVVPDSTHLIAISQPDAVAEAVLELLDGL